MDYQLENLGPERFQEVCQSLLVKAFPKTQCFPVGQRDGGRDALAFVESGASDDFIVFQVKYARKPQAEKAPHKWLIEVLEEEAPKVRDLIPKGAKAYYLLTNVPGTAHLGAGSIDIVQKLLSEVLPVPSQCFWREDLCRRLDDAWDLKWAYPEILSGSDVLRLIVERGLSDDRERRTDAISAFVRDQYDRDIEVRFKQVELQNQLLDLFIDVPATFRDRPTRRSVPHNDYRAFHAIAQENAPDDEYSPSREPSVGASTLLLHPLIQRYIPRIVLEGAPGQGKSTIAQYVCQIHRSRILGHTLDDPRVLINHRTCPIRLPFKVDLRDFALWLRRKDPFSSEDTNSIPDQWHKSLESFLAALVRHHSGGAAFSVTDIHAVARLSAVLLVFDGLDEVADIGTRQEVVDEIIKGVTRLEGNTVSLQTIVTSRPAAFANTPGLPEKSFRYFELGAITRPLIDQYAVKWLKARRLQGREAADVRRILRDKLGQPHLRELARNPMQLAILLSLIHTRGSSLPDKRTALYDNYVELFFSREAEKSEVVREHRDLLVDIHYFLAWTLHSESQTEDTRGSITADRLQRLVERYLQDEQHDASLAKTLFTGMVERVVALVSRVQGTFEFEVQPLREYFAARHLYNTAPYSPVGAERHGTRPDIFDALARDFYWLNVARFYAGCYSKGELPSLVDRLEELAREDGYRYTSHPQTLAATLVSDWVFAQHPKSMRKVVALILDSLGLRHVLAGEGGRHRRSAPLVLPKQNGNEELIDRCFVLLKEFPPEDFASLLIDVINANAGREERANRWLKESLPFMGLQRTRWIKYALYLGVLSELPPEQIDQVFSDSPLDSNRVSLLIRSGQSMYYQRSEQLFELAIDCILEKQVNIAFRRQARSVVEGLAYALDTIRYTYSFGNRQPIPLRETWRQVMFPGTDTEYELPSPPPFSVATKAMDLIQTAASESQRMAKEWATELTGWEGVVEKGRTLFGERWSFFCLAAAAAGIRSKSETYESCTALFDHAMPLCRRARYARLRAGNGNWWAEQLKSANSELDMMFAGLMTIMWAGPSVLTKLAKQIDATLSGISTDAWQRVFRALDRGLHMESQDASRAITKQDILQCGRLSERTIIGLGLRANATVADMLYDRCLKTYDGDDPAVFEFCQRAIMRRVEKDPNAWRQSLPVIARSYANGASSDPYFGYIYVRRAQDLPIDVAREIVDEADIYPSELVNLAERVTREYVSSIIQPVGRVAKRDHWFSE